MEAEGSGGLRSQRAWKITCHGYVQTRSLVLVCGCGRQDLAGGGRAVPGDSQGIPVGVGFFSGKPLSFSEGTILLGSPVLVASFVGGFSWAWTVTLSHGV